MISEAKVDDSFPFGNFLIGDFSKPHRLDLDSLSRGMLLYIREDILSNLLEVETKPIESVYAEINLYNDKRLVNCSYNPHKNMIGNHILALSEKLDVYSSCYNIFIILGHFNIEIKQQQFKAFCDNYGLKSDIRQPTCYIKKKQPPRGVLKNSCSENTQQIYRRTPMPKSDFNKVAKHGTSAWLFSCKFAAYFQKTFSQEHLWVAASEKR